MAGPKFPASLAILLEASLDPSPYIHLVPVGSWPSTEKRQGLAPVNGPLWLTELSYMPGAILENKGKIPPTLGHRAPGGLWWSLAKLKLTKPGRSQSVPSPALGERESIQSPHSELQRSATE